MQYRGLTIESSRPLSEITTIRLGGTPIARVVVEEDCGFNGLSAALKSLGGKAAVLGRGSNILARSGELPLVLVELGSAYHEKNLAVLEENKDSVTVSASAAMPLPLFIGRLASLGFGGLTGLAGIPGQLGGAVAMNAGSFGHSIQDCLQEVTLYAPATGLISLKKDELDIGYRRFCIPALAEQKADGAWFVLTKAVFRLPKQNPESLKIHMQECLDKKRKTQPVALASAGCVFKNPAANPAGMLLEQAGFKGKSAGGMSFSQVHANFMVNDGSGTSDQAFGLIALAQEAVSKLFGVSLELEVKVWP